MMSFVMKIKLYFGLFAADKLDSVKLVDFPFLNRIIIRTMIYCQLIMCLECHPQLRGF